MKFLGAIALLLLAVSHAHHVPEHTLRLHRFSKGYTYTYDAVLNVTSGVLGLSSQVSASVLRAHVKIYAKSNDELVLKLENVRHSGSVPAVDNKYADVPLRTDSKLSDKLSQAITFKLEGGKVTSYTLSAKDDLESAKIKRSILRSFEMEIPKRVLADMEKPEYANQPFMFNHTDNTDYGIHISNYIITASPDVEYPKETRVYNISRYDNCEGEWYPGYKLHHNFQEQGCPEVCRQEGEWNENFYRAGCPSGFEPHHSPIKRTFNHQQSLNYVYEAFTPETITTVETHFAKLYDQDMEVLLRYHLHRIRISKNDEFSAESRQKSYSDLHKWEIEHVEDDIDQMCDYKKSSEALDSAKRLLTEVSELIVKSEPGSPIGEKIILLREVLSYFTVADFESMAPTIVKPNRIEFLKEDTSSVARQVWLEMLPLVGTPDSLKFIVKYIKKELEGRNMLVWEAKEMMEALPQNIERPDRETIKEIEKLLEDTIVGKSGLLHSAAYVTMGRMIGEVCSNVRVLRLKDTEGKGDWFQKAAPEFTGLSKCPETMVLEIIEKISKKLKETEVPEKLAVYIETLTQTGMEQALWKVAEYVHGTAENMKHLTPRHRDFLRSAFVQSLHNMVGRHPQNVMEIVLPIYFNDTETPKLRNAAFGVIIRCQPSISLLQRVATHSWFEKSREVGSFVTSTLESFGNSSLPCMQLLSNRIKEILPQVKRFSFGVQHAKNHMWSYFDDLRRFGLEGRLEYTPNNESIVPSTFYQALTYTFDSMSDSVFQSSFNIEGLTQKMFVDRLMSYMDFPEIQTMSEREERGIFGKMTDDRGKRILEPRTVEDLRLVTYHKLFYKNSYNYLNVEGIKHMRDEFYRMFEKYLKKQRSGYSGYLVKLFLPSTYHTKAIAKTLPYPVEFQMRQPIVVSLGVKSGESTTNAPTLKHFDLHLKPSIHLSKVFTHQMKNLRDCKEVGVYYTHKISMTYPFQIMFDKKKFPNIVFKYKIPETEKKVLYYRTESGTYAGKKELESLPMNGKNVPIRTLPMPFKFEKKINPVGMPPFEIEIETEDINLFRQRLPRTPTEALHLAVKNIMNAGWRYKSANITLKENRALWRGENEAVFEVQYHRTHHEEESYENSPRWEQRSRSSEDMPNLRYLDRSPSRQSEDDDWNTEVPTCDPRDDDCMRPFEDDDWNRGSALRQSEDDDWNRQSAPRQSEDDDWNRKSLLRQSENEDWTRYMMPTKQETFSEFSENVQRLEDFMYGKPRVNHVLKISVTAKPLYSTAYLLMDYNHTYDKSLHMLFVEAVSKRANEEEPYKVNFRHSMGFKRRPNELHYDEEFGRQDATFRSSLSWSLPNETCPDAVLAVTMTGGMNYESNKDLLNKQLKKKLGKEYFWPETRQECIKDVRDQRPLSLNCIKAIREHSALNRVKMTIHWNEELPEHISQYARVADVYLKHYFFEHMHLKSEENEPKKIDISMEYIDKLVDEPLANFEIKKPSETVVFRQIPVANAQPFSSVYPTHEAALLKFTNNSYPARCVLSDSYVQTYDLVTYPFKSDDCQYVLTAHCTQQKNFAIILKGSGNKRQIHIHVGSTETVLLPRAEHSSVYKIIHDNKTYEKFKEPQVLNSVYEIYAFVEHDGFPDAHLRFIAKRAGINVLYDGKTVKIQVSLRYKGELCGLCSEFDGEEVREFRGLDRCLYTDYVDFANSALVQRTGRCQPQRPRGHRFCDDPERNWSSDEHQAPTPTEPRLPRNFVIYRGDEVCFSVRPVLSCGDDVEPSETESRRIGFHCLPKDDLTAKKLIAEAQWRPLDELRRKSVDYAQNVEVHRKC